MNRSRIVRPVVSFRSFAYPLLFTALLHMNMGALLRVGQIILVVKFFLHNPAQLLIYRLLLRDWPTPTDFLPLQIGLQLHYLDDSGTSACKALSSDSNCGKQRRSLSIALARASGVSARTMTFLTPWGVISRLTLIVELSFCILPSYIYKGIRDRPPSATTSRSNRLPFRRFPSPMSGRLLPSVLGVRRSGSRCSRCPPRQARKRR
jgi:hypothetical protein